jgi:anaerobic selenocysteine-containing dehydrogenase
VQAVPGGADRTGLAPEVPGLHPPTAARKFKDYPDFIVNFEAQPRLVHRLPGAGAARTATEHLRGEPNPKQWEMYAKNNCVFQYHMPPEQQYMRNWNQPYLDFAKDKGWRQRNDPVQLPSTPTRCRLPPRRAGQDPGRQPPDHLRERIATYFDPLPFWYAPLERRLRGHRQVPAGNAITQRPMAMYHSWDSQNAWLRQIHSHNYLHVNPPPPRLRGHRRRRLDAG